MTKQLTIDPRIQAWIAPLAADELDLLEASIAAEGCRDALIAWGDVLIDGHHRYEICRRLGKSFRVTSREFADRDHAEVWVRENQAARRNLTDDQRAMNARLLEKAMSRIAMRDRATIAVDARERKAGRKSILGVTGTSKITGKSRVKVAKGYRVPQNRVRRAKKIEERDPVLAKKVLAGDVSIKDAERELRERDRVAKRREAAEAAKQSPGDGHESVLHGDFRTVAATVADATVALVFTDPPYHDDTIGIYADVGAVAARVLKDGGSLITYINHHRLPEIIAMLQAAGLTFFWPLAVALTGGPWAHMREYGIVVHWKPLLWFVKGRFRQRDDKRFVHDLVESPAREKDAHPWQQSIHAARYYIEGLTEPGDLIFDPFCGGGTTALAASQTLRRWLTCDTDDQAVSIARKRVRDARSEVA